MLHRAFAALWHTARRVRITWHIVSALALEIGLAAPLSACGGGPPAAVMPTHMSTAISISATPTLESGHIDEFNVLPGSPDTFLFGIAKGSDGNLWVTYSKQVGVPVAGIARVTPAGVVTKFQVANPASEPVAITPGPDGALWFTEDVGNKIGRITTTGKVTEFTVRAPGSRPTAIVTGPDGGIWFSESAAGNVGRLTP